MTKPYLDQSIKYGENFQKYVQHCYQVKNSFSQLYKLNVCKI